MTKRNWFFWSMLPGTAFALLVFNGCNPSKSERSTAQSTTESSEGAVTTATPKDNEHGHVPGAHGGVMVSLGATAITLRQSSIPEVPYGCTRWARMKVV